MIGIYNDTTETVSTYQLVDNSLHKKESCALQQYGTFKEKHSNIRFTMRKDDVIAESQDPNFVYLARGKGIYKFFFDAEKAAIEREALKDS